MAVVALAIKNSTGARRRAEFGEVGGAMPSSTARRISRWTRRIPKPRHHRYRPGLAFAMASCISLRRTFAS